MGVTPRIAVDGGRTGAGVGVPDALLVREFTRVLAEGAPDIDSVLLPHAFVVAEAAVKIVIVG